MLVIPGRSTVFIKPFRAKNGYEGYLVGGCVRDALLGLTPKDWDLCTSARPEEVKACFYDKKLVLVRFPPWHSGQLYWTVIYMRLPPIEPKADTRMAAIQIR